LVKRTLSLLPLLMSTLLSLEPAATGFKMSGKRPGSEKLVHWSAQEKVMGTSDHLRGVGTAGSMFKTSRRVTWYCWFNVQDFSLSDLLKSSSG
jgi:hypothetical protein